MIITKTPFRISLVGGGSDMREFYKFHTGCVLNFTIDKYVYIVSHKYFFSNQIRLKYSDTETVSDIKKIKHSIFREIISKFDSQGYNFFGNEIGSFADIPSGTGMGSSSSFTVCAIHNFATIFNIAMSKEQIAKYACEIEIDRLKNPIGKQDQYAASYGGINVFNFYSDESVTCEKIFVSKDNLNKIQNNFILVYLDERRDTSAILSEQNKNIKKKSKEFDTIKEMTKLVKDAKNALNSTNSIDDIGLILDQAWKMKRKLSSKVTNDKIDYIYNLSKKNGAIGGKLLGAGGGGFLLLYCPVDKQEYLIDKLSLKVMSFKIERQGTNLINFDYD